MLFILLLLLSLSILFLLHFKTTTHTQGLHDGHQLEVTSMVRKELAVSLRDLLQHGLVEVGLDSSSEGFNKNFNNNNKNNNKLCLIQQPKQ